MFGSCILIIGAATEQDAYDANEYYKVLKRLYTSSGGQLVTLQELHAAMNFKNQVADNVPTGGVIGAAPAWFGPAMNAAMNAAMNPLTIRLDNMDTRLSRIEARLMNRACTLNDVLVTPETQVQLPAVLQNVTKALIMDYRVNECDDVAAYYGNANVHPNWNNLLVGQKRRAILVFLGAER